MHAQEEGLPIALAPLDVLDRARGEEIGCVAFDAALDVALVEIVHAALVAMAEVVDRAAHRAEEPFVTALARTEMRRVAEMPLPNERGRVPGGAQERRQRRQRRRQAELGIAARARAERLFGAAAKAILVAAGHQREPRGRAHRRIGVAIGEAQALPGDAIERRRHGIARAIATQIGVTKIVGEDEDEVGTHGRSGQRAGSRAASESRTSARSRSARCGATRPRATAACTAQSGSRSWWQSRKRQWPMTSR